MLARTVGQLLHIGFAGKQAPQEVLERVRRGEVGATILFGRNIESVEQVAALNAELAAAAPADAPLVLALDQEGGRVQRIKAPAVVWPPMAALGRLPAGDGERTAREVGRVLGRELAVLGFNMDYALVLDVATNPQNPVIGDRALATTPERVAALGIELARGLLDAGVLPCGKHYPGHGDTHVDSHHALPVVEHARERIEAIELAPFAAAARAGVLPIMMTAHVVFEALDPGVPATLSAPTLALLRGMGFDGVIASDDLEMKAIAGTMGAGEAALAAVRAGCDTLLICEDVPMQHLVHETLVKAAEGDGALRARLEDAARRVARMKAALPRLTRVAPADVRKYLGHADGVALADRLRAALG